jgi:DNA repair protein RecO (recombination protein O)
MIHETEGIVLHSIKYGETSLIVSILTPELGLQKFMVHGVRSTRAKIPASLFQAGSIVDLIGYIRPNRGIQLLKEVKSNYHQQRIPFQIVHSSMALFIIEITNKSLLENDPNTDLYKMLRQTLIQLDSQACASPDWHLRYFAGLISHLGFMPEGQYSEETPYLDMLEGCFCPCAPNHVYALSLQDAICFSSLFDSWEFQSDANSYLERQALLEHLITYAKLHIQNLRELNSPEILKMVLKA